MRHIVTAPEDEPAGKFVERLVKDATLVDCGRILGEKGNPLVFVEFTYEPSEEEDEDESKVRP